MNDLAKLSQMIVNHFNLNELKQVLYDSGVDYENLGTSTLTGASREAVEFFRRRRHVSELAIALAKRKPNLDFSPWGGPLPQESLSGVLGQLLNVGFGAGQLRTLAFGLFPDVYSETEPSQSKSSIIQAIVDYAIKSDGVLAMMGYIREQNPARYSEYFHRVDRALTAHQNKDRDLIPEVPTNTKPHPPQSQGVSGEMILALKMYANGLNDGGALAKQALKMLGEE